MPARSAVLVAGLLALVLCSALALTLLSDRGERAPQRDAGGAAPGNRAGDAELASSPADERRDATAGAAAAGTAASGAGGSSASDGPIVLGPALLGRVAGADGEPLRSFSIRMEQAAVGEMVRAWAPPVVERDFESPDGTFGMVDLAEGPWTVVARAQGYAASEPIAVRLPRADDAPLEIALEPATTLAGVVVDPTGAPVAGALVASGNLVHLVEAQSGRAPPGLLHATTGPDGRFALEGLPRGAARVTATADGFAPSAPLHVPAAASGARAEVELRLRAGGRIEGVVHDVLGGLAAGREVLAFLAEHNQHASCFADGSGRFELAALVPGEWQVQSFPSDEELATLEIERRDAAALLSHMASAKVAVRDGEVARVVLGAPDEERVVVRGTVRADGEPIRALVELFPEGADPNDGMALVQASEGAFAVELGRAGTWLAVAKSLERDRRGSARFTLELVADRENVVELALPTGAIGGRVLDPSGAPLPNAALSILHVDRVGPRLPMTFQSERALTDADGRYRFDFLEPGTYRVTAGAAPRAGMPGQALVDGVRIEAGERRDDVDLLLATSGNLTGRVVDAAGLPVPKAAVFARDERGLVLNFTSATYTDAAGLFRYDGLAPGAYTVSARTAELAAPDSAPVVVEAGAEPSVELVAQSGTVLRVRATDAQGTSREVALRVLDAAGREVGDLRDVQRLFAIFSGGFELAAVRIGPLPPGAYTLVARAADGDTGDVRVTCNGEPELSVAVDLR